MLIHKPPAPRQVLPGQRPAGKTCSEQQPWVWRSCQLCASRGSFPRSHAAALPLAPHRPEHFPAAPLQLDRPAPPPPLLTSLMCADHPQAATRIQLVVSHPLHLTSSPLLHQSSFRSWSLPRTHQFQMPNCSCALRTLDVYTCHPSMAHRFCGQKAGLHPLTWLVPDTAEHQRQGDAS